MTRETTPEQQSRDLLEQMGMLLDCGDGKTRDPQSMSSGELVFLANLIADKRRAEAERDALRKDAERWRALCNLWLMCTILTLTQDEDGRWSIEATEPVDNETFATLTGDDPDSAIDAALAGRE